AAIGDALANTPTLVVWDNFETVLPSDNPDEVGKISLAPDALKQLLEAGPRWFRLALGDGRWGKGGGGWQAGDGKTPVASRLPSTTRDTGFPHDAYQPSRHCAHHSLQGLAPSDALELAGTILEDNGLPRPPREQLLRLLDFLGGHPLSLQLVLPHLRETLDVD